VIYRAIGIAADGFQGGIQGKTDLIYAFRVLEVEGLPFRAARRQCLQCPILLLPT
jgi:hypothetical protein